MSIPNNPRYPTKKPLVLFYRDALEVLQDILKNPLVMDHLKFTPIQVFQSASGVLRLYEEWLSWDRAWNMQVCQTLSCELKLVAQCVLFIEGATGKGKHTTRRNYFFRQDNYIYYDWK